MEVASKIIQSYNSFVEKVHELDLIDDIEAKSILDVRFFFIGHAVH